MEQKHGQKDRSVSLLIILNSTFSAVASSEEGPIDKRQSSKREEMKTPAKKVSYIDTF